MSLRLWKEYMDREWGWRVGGVGEWELGKGCGVVGWGGHDGWWGVERDSKGDDVWESIGNSLIVMRI